MVNRLRVSWWVGQLYEIIYCLYITMYCYHPSSSSVVLPAEKSSHGLFLRFLWGRIFFQFDVVSQLETFFCTSFHLTFLPLHWIPVSLFQWNVYAVEITFSYSYNIAFPSKFLTPRNFLAYFLSLLLPQSFNSHFKEFCLLSPL